ncbi:FecR domain-containing protein [Echinicola jeungdonensis]|uniref:FecR family protein n=1 Tax=Echinicola jeungdonensis TaxID=709343 RepID=A0ABV5JBH7_9BACT|nr:FecR family protein [Echinicola jeungdonensis]MDN3670427.1 FecR domain-containing protein [Echinicola jeungdonensis]
MKRFDPENIEDFLKHPDFVKWVHQPTSKSDRYWNNWCTRNTKKVHLLRHAKEIIQGMKLEEQNEMSSEDHQMIREKLLAENKKFNSVSKTKGNNGNSKLLLAWASGIAASILILGFLYFGPNRRSEQVACPEKKVEWISKRVPRGVKKIYTLPDGTKVTMNSGSWLSYREDFEENRVVRLYGQAFFEVTKDPEHPFEIYSKYLKTQVLGTSFDVKSYKDEDKVHVAVVTGKVKVQTSEGITNEMTPGEATFYNKKDKSLTEAKYEYEDLIGWKEKILKFNRLTYPEVFKQLSRWYDVDFVVDEGVALRGQYTAKFNNQSLSNVLIGLSYSSNLSFDIQGKKVLVKQKR